MTLEQMAIQIVARVPALLEDDLNIFNEGLEIGFTGVRHQRVAGLT